MISAYEHVSHLYYAETNENNWAPESIGAPLPPDYDPPVTKKIATSALFKPDRQHSISNTGMEYIDSGHQPTLSPSVSSFQTASRHQSGSRRSAPSLNSVKSSLGTTSNNSSSNTSHHSSFSSASSSLSVFFRQTSLGLESNGLNGYSGSFTTTDLAVVGEFCELVGPRPLLVCPSIEAGWCQSLLDQLIVKVMSADLQSLDCVDKFTIGGECQALLKDNDIPCFVHYFTLLDLDARGYVRPFCAIYTSDDKEKLAASYKALRGAFSDLTNDIGIPNQSLFLSNLYQRRNDLSYTRHYCLTHCVAASRRRSKMSEDGTSMGQPHSMPELSTDKRSSGQLDDNDANKQHKRASIHDDSGGLMKLSDAERRILRICSIEMLDNALEEINSVIETTETYIGNRFAGESIIRNLRAKQLPQPQLVSPIKTIDSSKKLRSIFDLCVIKANDFEMKLASIWKRFRCSSFCETHMLDDKLLVQFSEAPPESLHPGVSNLIDQSHKRSSTVLQAQFPLPTYPIDQTHVNQASRPPSEGHLAEPSSTTGPGVDSSVWGPPETKADAHLGFYPIDVFVPAVSKLTLSAATNFLPATCPSEKDRWRGVCTCCSASLPSRRRSSLGLGLNTRHHRHSQHHHLVPIESSISHLDMWTASLPPPPGGQDNSSKPSASCHPKDTQNTSLVSSRSCVETEPSISRDGPMSMVWGSEYGDAHGRESGMVPSFSMESFRSTDSFMSSQEEDSNPIRPQCNLHAGSHTSCPCSTLGVCSNRCIPHEPTSSKPGDDPYLLGDEHFYSDASDGPSCKHPGRSMTSHTNPGSHHVNKVSRRLPIGLLLAHGGCSLPFIEQLDNTRLFGNPYLEKDQVLLFTSLLETAPKITVRILATVISRRRLVVLGTSPDQVARVISGIRLFMPDQNAPIKQWQTTFPELVDFLSFSVVGVRKSDKFNSLPRNLRSFVSLYDVTQNQFYGPLYTKGVLSSFVSKRMTHFHSLEFAQRFIMSILDEYIKGAFLSICTYSQSKRRCSPRKFGFELDDIPLVDNLMNLILQLLTSDRRCPANPPLEFVANTGQCGVSSYIVDL